MKKTIITAALFISTIPAPAIAASASVTLSNISITNTALDPGIGTYWTWDYIYYPLLPDYNPYDSTTIISEVTGNWLSPDYYLYKSEGIAKDKFYSVDVPSFSASTSIDGASASGSVVVDPNLISLQAYADASAEFRYSDSHIYSREYFHGLGLSEFDIHADYVLTADPGDNSLFASSEAYIQLTAFINGTPNLLFDKEIKFSSGINPGMHTESGTISLKILTPERGDGEFFGYFLWDTRAHVTQIPEPSTYALLLAGLGMLGFSGLRRTNR